MNTNAGSLVSNLHFIIVQLWICGQFEAAQIWIMWEKKDFHRACTLAVDEEKKLVHTKMKFLS